MRIVCLSDTHGIFNNINVSKADILVFCGDANFGSLVQIEKFNSWMKRQPVEFCVCIAGNHDLFFEKEPSLAKRCLQAIYLCDSGTEINGIHFFASPYTPLFMNWAFMEKRGHDIKRHWDMIPENTDVLITHGPPFGIGDLVYRDNEHVGCKDLLNRVKEIKPKYHLYGHIHNGYGIYKTDDTTFINCSVLNDDYQHTNSPIYFDI